MGRNMFGPDRGELDLGWTGWWGPEPPYGVPAFVLAHHEREPLVMGATTFDFVTDGIETALEQRKLPPVSARSRLAGGASTVNQCLPAGLVDPLHLHITPVVFGGPGERLFEGVPRTELEPLAGDRLTARQSHQVRRGEGLSLPASAQGRRAARARQGVLARSSGQSRRPLPLSGSSHSTFVVDRVGELEVKQ